MDFYRSLLAALDLQHDLLSESLLVNPGSSFPFMKHFKKIHVLVYSLCMGALSLGSLSAGAASEGHARWSELVDEVGFSDKQLSESELPISNDAR